MGDVELTLSSVSSNQQIVLGVTFVKSHFYEKSELNITNIVESHESLKHSCRKSDHPVEPFHLYQLAFVLTMSLQTCTDF